MFKILCFGNSNTWGFDTTKFLVNSTIEPLPEPWPTLLERSLGKGFSVIQNGLNGRLTNIDDPTWEDRNAIKQIENILSKSHELNLLIIMLGTNDLKNRFSRNPRDIGDGIRQLIHMTRNIQPKTKICIIAPCIIKSEKAFNNEFKNGIKKSKKLPSILQRIANEEQALYFDANQLQLKLAWDGIHFTSEDHVLLSNALNKLIKEQYNLISQETQEATETNAHQI